MESHGHLILVMPKWRVRYFEHLFILNCRDIILLNRQHEVGEETSSWSWVALKVWSEILVSSKSTGLAFLAQTKWRFQHLWLMFAKGDVQSSSGEWKSSPWSQLFVSKFCKTKHDVGSDVLIWDCLRGLGLSFRRTALCQWVAEVMKPAFLAVLVSHTVTLQWHQPVQLTAAGCEGLLKCSMHKPARGAWLFCWDGWLLPSRICNSWACVSVKRQVLARASLIDPTDFHKTDRNFLIFEVCSPLVSWVEAGQQIWMVFAGTGRQQEGISAISEWSRQMAS